MNPATFFGNRYPLNSVYTRFIFEKVKDTGSGDSNGRIRYLKDFPSLITATAPIFVALAGVWLLHEHVTTREKLGIVITIIGTVVIALQSFFETGIGAGRSVLGNSIIFVSNIAFAAYLLLSKEALRKKVSPFTITFMMFFLGFIMMIPLALGEVPFHEILPKLATISIPAQLSVLFMALFSGAAAYFLYQKAQKTIEASEAAVFTYLTPIVTAPVATIWLREKLTTPYIVGSIIIAVGVILAEYKRSLASQSTGKRSLAK